MNYFTTNPKEGYGYIYKYTSPSGKNYIGQTKYSLEKRSQKNGIGYKKCRAFYTAIQKYGFENFRWEILEECVLEDLDKKEAYYISLYNTLGPRSKKLSLGRLFEFAYNMDVLALSRFESMRAEDQNDNPTYSLVDRAYRALLAAQKHDKTPELKELTRLVYEYREAVND